MKTVKAISIMFIFIALIACGKKDEVRIIGTWEYSMAVAQGLSLSMVFTFNKDNSMDVNMFGQDIGKVDWKISGTQIFTTDPNKTVDSMSYRFDGDDLLITMDNEEARFIRINPSDVKKESTKDNSALPPIPTVKPTATNNSLGM